MKSIMVSGEKDGVLGLGNYVFSIYHVFSKNHPVKGEIFMKADLEL